MSPPRIAARRKAFREETHEIGHHQDPCQCRCHPRTDWGGACRMIGLYECTNVGAVGEDAIGDQAGHNLVRSEYFCTGVDGAIKGASHSGTLVSEWTGPKGTWISAVGITRTEGALR